MDTTTLLALYNNGIEVTPERYAFAREVFDALDLLLEEAAPHDKDSPSRLTGAEVFDAVVKRVGKKLLGG